MRGAPFLKRKKEEMQHRFDYNAKMQLKEKKLSAGLVSDRFPRLSSMVIHVDHYDKQLVEPLFMERTINVSPASYAFFDIACLTGECEGSFNLTPVISGMVKNHRRSAKGKLKCPGSGAIPAGHAYITYEISIKYKP